MVQRKEIALDFINYSKEATRYEYASFDNIKQKE